jgi:hypothetical protein
MRVHVCDLRRSAGAVVVLAAAAGLVLAGCGGGKSGGGSGSGGSGSGGSASTGGSNSNGGGGSSNGGGGTTTTSASVPFPVGVGYTWKYKSVGSTAGITGSSVNKITALKPVAGGQRVTMASTIKTDGVTTHSKSFYVIAPDGKISVPFSQFSSANSGAQVKLLSGAIYWPSKAVLDSGKVTTSTLKIRFVIGGKSQNLTTHVTVKGGGTQKVTVPAGTYTATLLDMTENEKIDGYKVAVEIQTWLADGVGPVKSQVIIKGVNGSNTIAAKNVLVSFTK